jgi:hypothetical protein
MIQEALQYLVKLGNTKIENIDGQVFSTERIHTVPESTAEAIQVNSLSGLVEYLKSKFDGITKVMVHVVSPTEVICFGTFNRDQDRNHYIKATAMTPSFSFDRYYDAESFNIKLQSCFVQNNDRDIMLKVVGNIKEEMVNTVGDDGISQAVTAKTGVATVTNVKVPNPVVLAPYRTFVEVNQPESNFVFRMKTGPDCALFEADGGAWKLAAMKNIKNYLVEELKKELDETELVIIA